MQPGEKAEANNPGAWLFHDICKSVNQKHGCTPKLKLPENPKPYEFPKHAIFA